MSEATLEQRRGAAERLRRILNLFVDADLDDDALAALEPDFDSITAKLAARPRLERASGALVTAASRTDLRPTSPVERDPFVGRSNPIAPPMTRISEAGSQWHVRFDTVYEGHPGIVHGGYVAAVFDNALATAAASEDAAAMTGTLETRFLLPTPAGTDLVCRAELERSEGRKHFARATLQAGGTIVAEAKGIFLHVAPDRHG